MLSIDGGLLRCWRRTARKLGSMLVEKWFDWLGEMKKERREEENGRIAPAKGKSDDQECGR